GRYGRDSYSMNERFAIKMQFAANISTMFKEYTFMDRISAASSAGFKAIECLFPYDEDPHEILYELGKENIKQVLINAPPGDWTRGYRGLAILPECEDAFERSVKTALQYAKIIECNRIHIMAGRGVVNDRTVELYVDRMKY